MFASINTLSCAAREIIKPPPPSKCFVKLEATNFPEQPVFRSLLKIIQCLSRLGHMVAQSVQWLGYGLDNRGSIHARGTDFFSSPLHLFTTSSRTALRPTQPPIQWVPGALSLRVKRPGCEAEHSPPSSAEVKNAWSYTSIPPIRLHGVVLS
jgi:hypothetical protein